MSAVAVACANMDVGVKFGEFRLNRDHIIPPVAGWSGSIRTFVQYKIAFGSRLEAASHSPDKCVQFPDPHSNRTGEIRPTQIRRRRHFRPFFELQ